MRTEPGEQPSKCKRLCCSLTSMSWEAAQSRPLSTQPTRQLLPLPREATSCCKGPRVFPGWGPNLLKPQLWRSIPCSQRGAGSLGAFQSPSCSEAPWVRKGHWRALCWPWLRTQRNRPLPVGGARAPSAGLPGNPCNAQSHDPSDGGTEGALFHPSHLSP